MTRLIQEQIESYGEKWKSEHAPAMERYDFVDFLDFGLCLLSLIRQIDQRYQQRLDTGQIPFDHDTIPEIHKLYEAWYTPCESLLKRIEEFESEGFEIDNAEAFRTACRSSHLPGLEPEKLVAAEARLRAGKGRALGEVMDEIRRRAGR